MLDQEFSQNIDALFDRCTAGLRSRAMLCLVLLLLLAAMLAGQTVNGTVTGVITDASGAIVPGVNVTVRNSETGQVRSTKTDSAGLYSIPALPPGPYTVDTRLQGYADENSQIKLAVGQVLNVNFALKVGATTEKVEVVANESLGLETQDHELNTVMDSATLENTPQYAGYRGATFYVQSTMVGVQPISQPGASGSGSNVTQYNEESNGLLIGGQGTWATSYLQDGVVDMDYFDQTATVQPPPEATDEVEVIRNNSNARYDGSNVLSVVSKSGTEQFHGRVYDEVENNQFDARGYNAGALSETRYNQFGADGGWVVPFTHKKVFFFADHQGFRDISAAFKQDLLPTQAERSGNFNADLNANAQTKQPGTVVYDPTTAQFNAATGTYTLQPFDYNGQENVIPPNEISPLATAYLNLVYPLPNSYATTLGDNYGTTSSRTQFTHDDYLFRGDYNISNKDHLYGAFNTGNPAIVRPEFVDNCICNETNELYGTDVYVEESHVISPTLVNTGRVALARSITGQQFGMVDNGTDYFTKLGLTGLNPPQSVWGWPQFNPASPWSGPSGSPLNAVQNMYEYSDEVNLTHGKHTVFLGGEFDWISYNAFWYTGEPNGALSANGEYTYNGSSKSAWQNKGEWVLGSVTMPAANSLADYLLGDYSSTNATAGSEVGYFRQNNVMPYFQDNWRVRNNLTLNLGLRYDNYSPPRERYGHAGYLNPLSGAYQPAPYNANKYNFSPRVGFAYGLGNNTAIHGGFGVYYFQFSYYDLQGMMDDPLYNTGLNSVQTQTQPVVWPTSSSAANPDTGAAPGQQEFFTLANAEKIWASMPAPTGQFVAGGSTFAQSMPTSYSEQWNLQIQRTLGSDWLAEIDYIGSADHHIYGYSNINLAALPGPNDTNPTSTADINSRRPFQSVQGNIMQDHKWNSSNYNGLELQLRKQFTHGFEFNSNFVWQKSLDFQDSDHSITGEEGLNPHVDYGPSDFNQKYVYKVSGIYELPFGEGKPFLNGGHWWQNQLGGWRFSGLMTVDSGFPLNVSATDTSNTGGGILMRAAQSCNGNNISNRSFNEWFNTSCYAQPAENTFGNERRNDIEGPRNTNMDLSVFKEFELRENLKFQWRTDAFSALNHPLPDQPQNSYTSSTFGEVTSWGGARIIQLDAKVLW